MPRRPVRTILLRLLQDAMTTAAINAMTENPEALRSMMESNPVIQRLMESHPEMREAFNNPQALADSMRAMANPVRTSSASQEAEQLPSQLTAAACPCLAHAAVCHTARSLAPVVHILRGPSWCCRHDNLWTSGKV